MANGKSNPTVSVIVPTYNSARTLDACLKSIREQTYTNIELIVVDNNSTDTTKQIASEYTAYVFNKGPERSAQRNFGVHQATGQFVAIIDSDMVMAPDVIDQAVKVLANKEMVCVVVPEESFGEGFWAQCKKLERSFYVGVSWMEAARIFRRKTYIELGGYNESMVSGEDWDLSQRASSLGKIGRTDAFIFHDEGKLKLGTTLRKKYYYAQKIAAYTKSANKTSSTALAKQTNPFSRYGLYFSKPWRLLRYPHIGIGMLFMKSLELLVGGMAMAKPKSGVNT